MLRASNEKLTDLARTQPALHDADTGEDTGICLTRFLGAGGMASVFIAELDPARRSDRLHPSTPHRFAVKLMQASTVRELAKLNLDPMSFFMKETVALARVMELQPPTDFVVEFYGSGEVMVETPRGVERLPWLAIEYVDGGAAGTSLTDRVARAADGVDPVRALRLARGVVEGVRALHAQGIVHRDLKPDNVLIAGPVDDETPKIADCGIARVTGVGATIAAMTLAYAGPEQALSIAGAKNPLIGPWTDVHALAALIWFVLAGETWCIGDYDRDFVMGARRSLRTAQRLHEALASDREGLDALDAILRRAASHRLPEEALSGAPAAEADDYVAMAKQRIPSMFTGPERYPSVDAFAAELLPALEALARRASLRAARENKAATAFRSTQAVPIEAGPDSDARATTRELPTEARHQAMLQGLEPAQPGGVVFQPDGRVLARFGGTLLYFVDGDPRRVTVPEERRAAVEGTRWIVRAPGGGFTLVGAQRLLTIRRGRFEEQALPVDRAIHAAAGDGRTLSLVIAPADEDDSPELWRQTASGQWQGPTALAVHGMVRALAPGPFGALVVGGTAKGRARAAFLGLDDQCSVFDVKDHPAFTAAVCSAHQRGQWAAGPGAVLRLERGLGVVPEPTDTDEPPISLGLDLVGVPWLLTTRAVLRRHVDGSMARWVTYHRRSADKPAWVGFGFTPAGVGLFDERGGRVALVPHDIGVWQDTNFVVAGG